MAAKDRFYCTQNQNCLIFYCQILLENNKDVSQVLKIKHINTKNFIAYLLIILRPTINILGSIWKSGVRSAMHAASNYL